MKYLIDTQILVWFQLNDPLIKPEIISLLIEPENQIFVSAVSLLEIAIKQKIGKLPQLKATIHDIVQVLQQDGFSLLPVTIEQIAYYDTVPLLADHRDPFDRFIIATSIHENLPVISADRNFSRYKPYINLLEA